MNLGICNLCYHYKELSISHAIPDSAFRGLFKQGSGKAVSLTNDESEPVGYTSDSLGMRLLCGDCEEKLNLEYDRYGISVLKGLKGNVKRNSCGVTFTGIDPQKFRMFFISTLWRMSISSHKYYSHVALSMEAIKIIREALILSRPLSRSSMSVAIYRLKDTKSPAPQSLDELRVWVVPPFVRNYQKHYSYMFAFFGFVVEIFPYRLPAKMLRNKGVIGNTGSTLMCKYYEMADMPELIQPIASSLGKHERGFTQIPSKK